MAAERREHRLALEILYAVDIGKAPLDDALRQARDEIGVFSRGDAARAEDPYEEEYPAVERREDAPRPTDWDLVDRLVRGTLTHQLELEAQIAPLLRRWKLERLSGVDRLILEMSAWELRYRPGMTTTGIINHAIELAHRLSTEKSGEFVNAILDALAKTPAPPATVTGQ
ncbi:MAG: transcription antitermination factor NusB [Candidatus Eremiobacteraeota bacterium]|nr:transcription antitermination factor NusB [Candidatus Eremiobacteraeota bacterium]MBV8262673.1 transcription antitermination factor NusB [Candidatus Eremiobacteraeota bacterium]MBV8339348.1 transcription antitermination factor NusB [Candidatus Eremiobacteraeota bacterium]MBV8460200.1 transcription antitermination factor NusB [Candidatus Eremiobacteraeota bacterium]MBV8596027.1 transcription antitermination factor NusB [Candidatus Eremiobacteraeota bacterium]